MFLHYFLFQKMVLPSIQLVKKKPNFILWCGDFLTIFLSILTLPSTLHAGLDYGTSLPMVPTVTFTPFYLCLSVAKVTFENKIVT